MARVVHVKHRLDIDHASQNCGGFGNPAAPVQMKQVIDGKVVAHMQFIVFQPVHRLIKLMPFSLHSSALCTSSPSPREAHRESITAIRQSGRSSMISLAARATLSLVPLRPLEKAI